MAEVLLVPTAPISDFYSYYRRAQNLVLLGSYSFDAAVPDATFPPGYSLLLACAFKVLTMGLLTAKMVNAVLGAASIVLAALLARCLWGSQVGLATALLSCVYPRYLLMPGLIASENLFMPLLLAWALLMVRPIRGGDLTPAALTGAVVGLMASTRSVAYPLGFVWPLVGAMVGRSRRVLVRETLVLLTVQHLVMLPWALRNQATLGHFSFLGAVGGLNLFIGNNPKATGEWMSPFSELERTDPGFSSQGAFERDAIAGRQAVSWILQHPDRALELYVERLRLMTKDDRFLLFFAVSGEGPLSLSPNGKVLPDEHPLKRAAGPLGSLLDYSYWLVSSLQLGGCLLAIRGWRRENADARPGPGVALLIGAGYLVLAAAACHGSSRFRWPSTDLLMPLAGLALVWLSTHLRGRLRLAKPES